MECRTSKNPQKSFSDEVIKCILVVGFIVEYHIYRGYVMLGSRTWTVVVISMIACSFAQNVTTVPVVMLTNTDLDTMLLLVFAMIVLFMQAGAKKKKQKTKKKRRLINLFFLFGRLWAVRSRKCR